MESEPNEQTTWSGLWSTFACCLLVVVTSVAGCGEPNQYQPPPPPTVKVATPLQLSVNDFLEEVGTTEAVSRADVRARVRGILESIAFMPGQEVAAGDILYRLEQDDYLAAQSSAAAALAASKANAAAAEASIAVVDAQLLEAAAVLAQAESAFAREDQLIAQNATSRAEWERAKANRESALATQQSLEAKKLATLADSEKMKAEIDRAQAELERAELDLARTIVTAPIGGSITSTDVKVGNLVEPGTQLATIVQTSPMWVNFRVSENVVLTLSDQRDSGATKRDVRRIPAMLQRATDSDYSIKGRLDYVDQTGLDRSSGTLGVRAEFPNDEGRLIPGLFVRVRVPIGFYEQALLVPESAVGRDPVGAYVLVANGDTVERREVVVGSKYGKYVLIREGLESSDRVIVEGLQRARPGATVTADLVVSQVAPNIPVVPLELPEQTEEESAEPIRDQDVSDANAEPAKP